MSTPASIGREGVVENLMAVVSVYDSDRPGKRKGDALALEPVVGVAGALPALLPRRASLAAEKTSGLLTLTCDVTVFAKGNGTFLAARRRKAHVFRGKKKFTKSVPPEPRLASRARIGVRGHLAQSSSETPPWADCGGG
jgi:hypothetical protein